MKSVLRSVKPYWFYLICEGKKKVEVCKTEPLSKEWDGIVYLYCSKDMRSFNRIPEEYREKYKKYLGTVGASFYCYGIMDISCDYAPLGSCLTTEELMQYGNGRDLYGWYISDLKIYDKPRELGEFLSCKYYNGNECTLDRSCVCPYQKPDWNPDGSINIFDCEKRLTRPPQSWCYVEEVEE